MTFPVRFWPDAWANAIRPFDKAPVLWLVPCMRKPRIWASLDPFYEHGAILGRKVANEGFIRTLLDKDPFEAYHFFLPSQAMATSQGKTLEAAHPALFAAGKFKILTRRELPDSLRENEYAAFHLSDCIVNPAALARLRNALARNVFPITSVTHSLSYADYPARFLRHLWPGTTSRDVIAATSRAGREAVAGIFRFLREAYGLSPEAFPAPGLEVVPLGVDPTRRPPAAPGEKAALRARLGLPAEAVVFLVFGRVSHSSKMDLLPILRAFQRLLRDEKGLPPLYLILAGWLDEEGAGLARMLMELAHNIGLPARVVKSPDEALKHSLFAASDVFISLPDNPQETFGLTVLEAMACGLPVIGSRYDGYKDLAVDGETGFLVDVTGPAETGEADMLGPLMFDNHLHLLLAQQTAPDPVQAAGRIRDLAVNPGLRERMGRAGRERVLARFTWDAVIDAHLILWERLAAAPVPDRQWLRTARHPLEMRYAEVFRGYPSRTFDEAMPLVWTKTGEAVARNKDFPIIYEGVRNVVCEKAVRACLVLARKPVAAGMLVEKLVRAESELDPSGARYHILWCVKQDFLEPAQGGAGHE